MRSFPSRQRHRQRKGRAVVLKLLGDADVELDEARRQLQEVSQAGVSGAGIIDGEDGAGGAQGRHGQGQAGVIQDGGVLGQLDDQPVGNAVRDGAVLRLTGRPGARAIELRDIDDPGTGAEFRGYALWDYWPQRRTAVVSVTARDSDYYLVKERSRPRNDVEMSVG